MAFENVKSILDKTDISTKKRDENVDSVDITIQWKNKDKYRRLCDQIIFWKQGNLGEVRK